MNSHSPLAYAMSQFGENESQQSPNEQPHQHPAHLVGGHGTKVLDTSPTPMMAAHLVGRSDTKVLEPPMMAAAGVLDPALVLQHAQQMAAHANLPLDPAMLSAAGLPLGAFLPGTHNPIMAGTNPMMGLPPNLATADGTHKTSHPIQMVQNMISGLEATQNAIAAVFASANAEEAALKAAQNTALEEAAQSNTQEESALKSGQNNVSDNQHIQQR